MASLFLKSPTFPLSPRNYYISVILSVNISPSLPLSLLSTYGSGLADALKEGEVCYRLSLPPPGSTLLHRSQCLCPCQTHCSLTPAGFVKHMKWHKERKKPKTTTKTSISDNNLNQHTKCQENQVMCYKRNSFAKEIHPPNCIYYR